jgi:hypothetical protein
VKQVKAQAPVKLIDLDKFPPGKSLNFLI